ncbi:MAG: serine/threonine protein kinase [Candidatus Azotimanducaceae bacterium]|jgi:serine/threonine protein kinase
MTLKFTEGQNFTDQYSLLHHIDSGASAGSSVAAPEEQWLAVNTISNERVTIKILLDSGAPTEPTQQIATLESRLNAVRGLIHPCIARTLGVGVEQSFPYVVTQYEKGLKPLNIDQTLTKLSKQIDQLIETMMFVHGFGISHGSINPNNLLVLSEGSILITDFVRLPMALNQSAIEYPYASPQALAGQPATISDDIYALGALLYRLLTQRDWQLGRTFESDHPIPADLRNYLAAMLAHRIEDRATDLSAIRSLVAAYNDESSSNKNESITPSGFSKVLPASNVENRKDEGSQNTLDSKSSQDHKFVPIVEHATPRERSVMSASAAFFIFALIAIIGGIVFFYLPTLVPVSPTPISSAAETKKVETAPISRGIDTANSEDKTASQASSEAPLAPMEAALLEKLIIDGQTTATQLLRKQLQLEDLAVYAWAKEEYSTIVDLGLAGDDFYRLKNYQAAMDSYQDAMDKLDLLLAQVDGVQEVYEQKGETALLEGDEATAREAYKTLNAIEPGNPDIEHALVRAENLSKVLAMMKSGEEFEENRALEKALAKYEDAYELDPEWEPAIIAIERTEIGIVQSQFNASMSRAFTAFADRDYEAARTAFSEAGEIIPESSEPADGLLQIEIAIKQFEFSEIQVAASALVEQEEWAQALQAYKNALDQDSTLVFAKKGYQESLKRNNLDLALNRFINSPAVMSKDSELAKAKKLLVKAAREKNHRGPKLKKQINDLSLYVSYARIPVELDIQSDNKTDVTVYRIATLGKINQTRIELIPGSYTIVGTRKGYRDVHENLTLLGGRGIISVDVSCSEKI